MSRTSVSIPTLSHRDERITNFADLAGTGLCLDLRGWGSERSSPALSLLTLLLRQRAFVPPLPLSWVTNRPVARLIEWSLFPPGARPIPSPGLQPGHLDVCDGRPFFPR